mgnify:CR=1 FL=1
MRGLGSECVIAPVSGQHAGNRACGCSVHSLFWLLSAYLPAGSVTLRAGMKG